MKTLEYVTKFYKFCYKHQTGSVVALSAEHTKVKINLK